MTGDVTPYTDVITSEHYGQPDFMAMVAATCQPFADLIAVLNSISALYDVEKAVGQQLDVGGEWVGESRELVTPLTGVYFALDTAGVGLDQGILMGPYDPVTGLTSLPDEQYRLLIGARILNNVWDCDTQDAYLLLNSLFLPLGYQVFIEDHADLTMGLGIIGLVTPPDALIIAMLTGGLLNVKPIGVHISDYQYQTQLGPLFALDLETTYFAGLDVGAFGITVFN